MLIVLTVSFLLIVTFVVETLIKNSREKLHDSYYGYACPIRVIRARERLLSSEYKFIEHPKWVYYPEYMPLASNSYRGFILKSDKTKEVNFTTRQQAEEFIYNLKYTRQKEYHNSVDRFGAWIFGNLLAMLILLKIYSVLGWF